MKKLINNNQERKRKKERQNERKKTKKIIINHDEWDTYHRGISNRFENQFNIIHVRV